MRKSYSSLTTLSGIFTLLGYAALGLGILLCIPLFIFFKDQGDQGAIIKAYFACFGELLLTLLISLLFGAISQFIKLCIDVASDISAIRESSDVTSGIISKPSN